MPLHQKTYLAISPVLLLFLSWILTAPSGLTEFNIDWEQEKLQPGIVWVHAADSLFGAPQYLNILIMDADTAAARFRLEAADRLGAPRRDHSATEIPERVTRLTASEFAYLFDPLAVVNAGFFSDHPEYVSSGIFKVRGEVYPFQKEEPEELRFVGRSAIGLDEEGNWLFRNREDDTWPADWPEAYTAVAGAHRLLEEGRIPEPVAGESYQSGREQRHAGLRHPRTAICLTSERDSDSSREHPDDLTESKQQILILVADGRHEEAVGLTLKELAEFMLSLGCRDAVNLDGGGSSTMYIRGEGVVNHPSDNGTFDHEGERAVRTVIMVRRK
ncbi:MAG: phosphodiester glycosidase family protein [Cyclonatronaceae bacterium]